MAIDFPSSPSVGQVYQTEQGYSFQWDGTVWKNYYASGVYGGPFELVTDTTPDLGGYLNLNNKGIYGVGIITATGGFNIGIQSGGTNVTTGVITALNFIGTGNTITYNPSTKTVSVRIQGGGGGSSLSVGTRTGSTNNNDAVSNVSSIRFSKAPFTVQDLGGGEVLIISESSFNPIIINGDTSSKVQASGEETLNLIPGTGITITPDNTSTPKSITISASGGGGGGATSLGDLSDVDLTTTAPTAGKVLKYNGTAWVPGTDATGSGGGGGGAGDGSIPLGTPTDGSYTSLALLAFTEETQVNDAIDSINEILFKLTPAKPANLSTITLSLSSTNPTYTIKQTSNNTIRNDATDNPRPETNTTSAFWDGDNGTLSFEVDGVTDGSKALSTDSDIGTFGGLTIVSDVDPYAASGPPLAGFWKQLTAKGRASANLSAGSAHTYRLKHTITGNSGIVTFFVDNPGNVTAGSGTVDVSAAAGDVAYISGVPSYKTNGALSVGFTINGAVGKGFNSTKIADITGTQINTSNIAPDPAGYTEGQAITFTGQTVNFSSSRYAESGQITLNVKGYNSKGIAGSSHSIAVSGRIDTVSNESGRKRAGSGLYPTSGTYGTTYDSTQSLKATGYTEEAQLLNGKYQYPQGNYTTALNGPDYSTGVTGTRYFIVNVGTIDTKLSVKITISGDGLVADTNNISLTQGITMHLKVDGATTAVSTGWLNINEGPNYSVGNPTNNGDKALLYLEPVNHLVKNVPFGSQPKTGTVWVRIGILSTATNIKINPGVTLST